MELVLGLHDIQSGNADELTATRNIDFNEQRETHAADLVYILFTKSW